MTDVAFAWRTPSADALWEALLGGTVRAAAQVRGQTDAVQQRIHRAFEGIVGAYRAADGEGLDIPVAVKIGSARKAL